MTLRMVTGGTPLALMLLLCAAAAHANIPFCGQTCNGGPQPTSTGGDAIQQWTAVNNQRGVGGAMYHTLPAVKSVNIQGSQSYTYVVPLFDIPGRGLGIHLELYYNSLVWPFNSENNSMDYAADFQTSPGFYVGYGSIAFPTDQAVGMFTEPTGARHLLVRTSSNADAIQFRTTDSSYMHDQESTNGSLALGALRDGTQVFYQSFTVLVNGRTQYRPYQIKDTNGNFISITYNDPNDLFISQITDTVGRAIQFTYDSTGKMLQNVNLLDGGGNVVRQYTFSWAQNQTLTFNFTRAATAGLGLTPGYYTSGLNQSPNQINLLTKVTRPDGTSVVFDYVHDLNGTNPDNPDWGIVKSIQEQSSNGTPRLTTSYLFPAASAGALITNPTYTKQTVNDGVNTKTWTFQATVNSNQLVTSFVSTDPCGNTMTTTFSSAGNAADGLPIEEQMASPQTPPSGCPTSTAKTWRTVNKTWTTLGDGSNPKLLTVSSVLEDGTTQSQVKFKSYDNFGQVTDQLEYDFGANGPGPLLREVVTTYANFNSGIVNRPSQMLIKNGAGTTVARTDLSYDDYSTVPLATLSQNPVGHDPAWNSSFYSIRGNLTSMTSYTTTPAGTGGIPSSYS